MQVVGITTQQEFWVASKERRFKINELLVVEDSFQQKLIGEVVETSSYNRYIPFSGNSEMVDLAVLKSLETLGYNIGSDTIHIAKVRLMIEAAYPVETGAIVRTARIEEVRKYLMPKNPHKGLIMGVIKSTEDMYEDLSVDLKNIVYIFSEGKLEKQKQVPFVFDIHSMSQYPHIGVFGGSGSGKSFAVRVFLEELMKKRIPAVVFDPHYEMDFSTLSEQGNEENIYANSCKVLKVGYNVGVNFSNLTTGDLKSLLSSSSPLTEAMSDSVDMLQKKKDTFSSFSDRLDLLCEGLEIGKTKIQEFLAANRNTYERDRFENMIELLNEYSNQVPLMSVKEVAWRLKRLQNEGIFNSDITPVEEGLRKGKVVIIQGTTRLLQVFASYLLNNLYQKRRTYKDLKLKKGTSEFFPPFFIVTDQAHSFAPKAYDTASKSVISEIAQEGRKYGIFLLLASQRPSLLDDTIIAQLSSKFIFRMVRSSDISIIREETDIDPEEAKRLPYLCSGDAFFSSETMGRTINIRIRDSFTESPHVKDPFEELQEVSHASEEDFLKIILSKMPIGEPALIKVIDEINKESGIRFEQNEFLRNLDLLAANKKIEKRQTPFGYIYDKI